MEDSKKFENFVTRLLSFIGFASILINLSLKGVNYVNILDAIKDSVSLLITLFVFVYAIRIKRESETPLSIAEGALKKIQGKYNKFLTGPEYFKKDYNPEDNKSTGMKFLFIQRQKYKTKTALIPLDPLGQGILDIRLSRSTLLNLKYQPDQLSDEKFKELQDKLKQKILNFLKKNYDGAFEDIACAGNNKENSALIIDFDENQMGLKKFSKAIYQIAEITVEFLEKEI